MKLHDQKARGEEAKALLENRVLQDALDEAERRIIDTWRSSEVSDEAGQRMCKLALRAQENFRQVLQSYISNGEMATHELLQTSDPTKPKRGPIHG